MDTNKSAEGSDRILPHLSTSLTHERIECTRGKRCLLVIIDVQELRLSLHLVQLLPFPFGSSALHPSEPLPVLPASTCTMG